MMPVAFARFVAAIGGLSVCVGALFNFESLVQAAPFILTGASAFMAGLITRKELQQPENRRLLFRLCVVMVAGSLLLAVWMALAHGLSAGGAAVFAALVVSGVTLARDVSD